MALLVPWDSTPHVFDSGCLGKEKFPSEGAAEGMLTFAKKGRIRDRSYARWDSLGAYQCKFCGFWHTEHP